MHQEPAAAKPKSLRGATIGPLVDVVVLLPPYLLGAGPQ